MVSKGADQEGQSAITRAMAPMIAVAPGIAKDTDGKPLADRGLNMGIPVLRKDGSRGQTTMRGLAEKGQGVRPELKIVAGRMFERGKREACRRFVFHVDSVNGNQPMERGCGGCAIKFVGYTKHPGDFG